ncbi:MAG TPA: GIY-YIG nuclease family protein [Coleofasciculaceae cyanobacterium]|jgi:hypothetical protein
MRTRVTFYVDKVPGQPLKGRGWIDISDIEIAKRLNIPLLGEHTNPTIFKRFSLEEVERKSLKFKVHSDVNKVRGVGIYPDEKSDGGIRVVIACKRGKAGGKKFTLVDPRETIKLTVQKSLNIESVCAWVRTWASDGAEIITPSGKTIALDGDNLATTEYVYFIHSEESNTIKIGRAKNVEKRLKSLQTANPYELKIIKMFKVKGGKAAQELEHDLHQKFDHLRLSGEWFKAEPKLLDYQQN